MFFYDHAPSHLRVRYAEHRTKINVQTLEIIERNLPRTALSLVYERATEHQTRASGELGIMCADAVTEEDRTSVLILPFQATAPWDVRDLVPLQDYRLAVRFTDGTAGIVDLSARVVSPKAGVFAQLRDPDTFAQVYIEYGAVTWPSEIDLAPDAMHDEIKAHGEWKIQ